MNEHVKLYDSMSVLGELIIDYFPVVFGFKDTTDLLFIDSLTHISAGTVGSGLLQYTATSTITPVNCPTYINGTYDSQKQTGIMFFDGDLKELGNSAFAGKTQLKNITFPKTLSTLGSNVFEGCTSLSTLDFTHTLITALPSEAFKGCTNLTDLKIPNNIVSLGDGFLSGTNITRFTIPSGVNSLTKQTFLGSNISEISVNNLNQTYDSRNECNAVIHSKSDTLMLGFSGSTVPATVTRIGQEAFSETNIQQVDLQNVQKVEDKAFLNCTQLSTVTAETTTDFGNQVFEGCTSLQNVSLSANLNKISHGMFKNCTSLQSITLPASIKNIESDAFVGCSSLAQITIPESVTILPENLFQGCSSLRSVTVGNDVEEFGSYCFSGCSQLTSLNIPNNLKKLNAYCLSGTGITTLTLPEGFTTLSTDALQGCTRLTTITLPSTISKFDYTGLTGSKVSTINYNIPYSLWGTSYPPFYDARGTIQVINFGDGVKEVPYRMFYNSTKLTTVRVSTSVNNFLQEAFDTSSSANVKAYYEGTVDQWAQISFSGLYSNPTYAAKGLYINNELVKSIRFADDTVNVNPYCFAYCTGITSLDLNNVQTVGSQAFYNCSGLTSIRIPASIQSISSNAFAYTNISSVHWCSDDNFIELTNYDYSPFANIRTKITSITFDPNLKRIPSRLFALTNITSIAIPALVETVGIKTFAECPNLTSITVDSSNTFLDSRENCNAIIETATNTLLHGCLTSTIPDSVTALGHWAFQGNASGDIIIPEQITSVGEGVYCGCPNITSITFNSLITDIPSMLLYGCTGLTTLTIPAQVTTIGNDVLSGCSNLATLILLGPPPTIGTGNSITALKEVIVQTQYLNDYLTNESWAAFKSKITDKYVPVSCQELTITADDIILGHQTETLIHYNAVTSGSNYFGEEMTNVVLTGDVPFTCEQNLTDTEIVRTATYTYLDKTAETTFIHKEQALQWYTVDLNNQWRPSADINNPDSEVYEGVYESFSNINKKNSGAFMYIELEGYDSFDLYIRSYSQSNYDYVIVGNLDASIQYSTSYSSSLVAGHTRNKSTSDTDLTAYTKVSFTDIPEGVHKIPIAYKKNASINQGTDQGYLLIPKKPIIYK